LSEVIIPNRKRKVVPSAFNVDKVMDEEGESGPVRVWQPKIAGKPDPVTPPQAKKGKRGAEQKKAVVSEADSDRIRRLKRRKSRRRKEGGTNSISKHVLRHSRYRIHSCPFSILD
jgi:hypothetical protein